MPRCILPHGPPGRQRPKLIRIGNTVLGGFVPVPDTRLRRLGRSARGGARCRLLAPASAANCRWRWWPSMDVGGCKPMRS